VQLDLLARKVLQA
jgi:hypothetical protein